jgi:hypothetical protein
MKHLVGVLIDQNTEPHRVVISHGDGRFLNPNEPQIDIVAKDINTLCTGLVMSIRNGGEKGYLNKYETLENVISYLRKSLSVIDIATLSAEEMQGITSNDGVVRNGNFLK